MKTAYELAMEHLAAQDPEFNPAPLSDAQKAELAELDRVYEARIAEKALFLDEKIRSTRNTNERQQLQTQRQREIQRLNEERETAKAAVRQSNAKN